MIYLWYNVFFVIAVTFLNGMTSREGNRLPVAIATFGLALSLSILAWATYAVIYLVGMYWQ